MRRINISLDEETSNLLAKKTNQSETVREALRMYHGGITTDTLVGMRAAFIQLDKRLQEFEGRFVELYEMVEETNRLVTEMSSR